MNKRIVIFLILVIIFLSALLFGKMTGKVVSSFESCKDSDNGLDYSVKGEINGISYSVTNFYKGDKYQYEDYCEDNKHLIEYYCEADNSLISYHKKSITVVCPNSCENGRCVD